MFARRHERPALLALLWLTSCGGGEGVSSATGGALAAGGDSSSASGGTAPEAGSGGTSNAFGGASTGGIIDEPSDCRSDGDGKTSLAFVNRCAEPVTFRGSDIEGGDLGPGEVECRDVGSDLEPISAKRYWGHIGEDPGAARHTLAEFTFNTDFYDFDWYNISHVDSHNLPILIAPLDRPDCDVLSCPEPLLDACPDEGRGENGSGQVISCVSPDRDDPESTVAQYFESCDDAYAWSGDDQRGDDPSPVRACAGEDWEIVFCPPSLP